MEKHEPILIVCGHVNGEDVYWSNDKGWVNDESMASCFDHRILSLPMPEGGTGILEILDGQPVHFYGPLPHSPLEFGILL